MKSLKKFLAEGYRSKTGPLSSSEISKLKYLLSKRPAFTKDPDDSDALEDIDRQIDNITQNHTAREVSSAGFNVTSLSASVGVSFAREEYYESNLKKGKIVREGKTINEMVLASDVLQQAQEGAEQLQQSLPRILGDQYKVVVRASKNLGLSIDVWIHGINPHNNIPLNSPIYFAFTMFLQNKYGEFSDMPEVAWESDMIPRVFKWRKIKSNKSVKDANDKFLEWIKKSKPLMDETLISGRRP